MNKPILHRQLLAALAEALRLTKSRSKSGESADKEIHDWGLKILLVEDNYVNQQLARMLLEETGNTISIVENGKLAVEAWREGAFDLILMDIQMPIMDGFEAAAEIRKIEGDCDNPIPIIAMTAHAMRGDRERCIDAGMNDYVAKPIEVEDLYRAIRDAANLDLRLEEKSSDEESSPGIDWPKALNHLGGNEDMLRHLAGIFAEDCERMLTELHSAIAKGDAEAIGRTAHSIKGSVTYFGMDDVRQWAEMIEKESSENDISQTPQVGNLIEQRLRATLPEIRKYAENDACEAK